MPDPSPDAHASDATTANTTPGWLGRLRARLHTRPHTRPYTRPYTRLAALGIVGAVMIVLPLVQVLRYQNAELQALLVERAGLDPAAQAVEVQRGLIAHRDLASQVLLGDVALEPQRKLRQSQVDQRVGWLAVALAGGPWEPARRESDALREDWSVLAGQVEARSIGAADSEDAHRLLAEQTLQVIDLLADASPPHAHHNGDDSLAALLAAMHGVPALAWQMDALAAAPAGARSTPAPEWREGQKGQARRQSHEGHQGHQGHERHARHESHESFPGHERHDHDLASAEASLARVLGSLDAALERPHGLLATMSADRMALATASAAARATAEQLLRQRHAGAPHPTDTALAAAALHAQFTLFTLARNAAEHAVAAHSSAIQHRRGALLATMAALALLALALAAHLLHGLRMLERAAVLRPVADAGGVHPPAPSGSRLQATRLFERLRSGDDRRSSRVPKQPQPTEPPER